MQYETYYDENGNVRVDTKTTNTTRIKSTVKSGISFGSCLAMVISFVTWQSVPWAIIHGLLGWVYIIYYVIRY